MRIMYVSGNVGRNRKWNGIEQKISLSDFIARYEKHFLTEDTYAEVETGGEAGRLLAAGSTGEIGHTDDRRRQPQRDLRPGRRLDVRYRVRISSRPHYGGLHRIRLVLRHERRTSMADPSSYDHRRALPGQAVLVLPVNRPACRRENERQSAGGLGRHPRRGIVRHAGVRARMAARGDRAPRSDHWVSPPGGLS